MTKLWHDPTGVHLLSDRQLGSVAPLTAEEVRVLDNVHRRIGYNNAILTGSVFDDPGVVGTDPMEDIKALFDADCVENGSRAS